jgi:hypothetical protein
MSAVDDTAFETVEIEGVAYKVPQAVVKEIDALRERDFELIRNFHANEDDTIVITFPDGLGPEAVERLGEIAQQQFGEGRIALVPESMGFHTQDKLTELLSVGADLAEAVRTGDGAAGLNALAAWRKLTGAE